MKFEGHYHGWFDETSFSVTPTAAEVGDERQPRAVPWTPGIASGNEQNVIILPWNNFKLLQEVLDSRADDIMLSFVNR